MGKRESSNMKKEKGSENGGGRDASDGTKGELIGDARFSRLHTDPRFQRLPKSKTKVVIDSRFALMFTDKGFSNPSVNKQGIKSKSSGRQIDPLRRYYKVDEEASKEDERQGGDGGTEIVTKKKRGRKDGVKKKKTEELSNKGYDEIDDNHDSADELGASTSIADISPTLRKRRGKKDRLKKLEAHIPEALVYSKGTEEDVDEVEDGLHQRARVRTGAVGTSESEEDTEDDDDLSGLEEGLKEEEEEEEEDGDGSSSSSSSSDSESEVEQEISEAEAEEKIPTTKDETRRLAIVNMDWEHIRAVHLLVLMRSFAPKGGSVYSVTVYPSEFGIEQMEEENVHGPKSIFRNNDDEDGSDAEEADPEKLRQYEKAKMRYYYAVVECDSASTAAVVYKNCDGLEFERTSNTLDLRFIPDEMEFKREPRDSASDVPVDYKAIEFETRALQHSNVKLTWDDDEPVRVKALRRNFNRDELNEMDFRAYVASSSESESEAEAEVEAEAAEVANGVDRKESIEPAQAEDKKKEKVRSKYLALLARTDEADSVRGKKTEKGNIEIKFHTGLDELSEKLLAKTKKDKADETVWEAYLRRKKEKKHERRKKKSAVDSDVSSEDEVVHSDDARDHKDDPFFSHGDEDPFDDPFFNQDSGSELPAKTGNGREGKERKTKDLNRSKKEEERKRKKDDAAKEKKELEKKQAELELLLLDDHMVQNGEVEVPLASSLDDPGKTQKVDKKKKKGAKGKVEQLQNKIASNANYDDPRFASLFTSHLFALDPTDPQFKKTGAQVVEMQRRHFQSSKIAQEQLDTNDNLDLEEGSKRKRKAEVSSLVRSLKSKVQGKALGTGRR